MSTKSVSAVLNRLKTIAAAKSDAALATALGVSPQTLSSWKARESVPYAICVETAEREGIALDWLLAGEGPMRRRDEASAVPESAASTRFPKTLKEESMLVLFRSLNEEDQAQIQGAAREKQRLREIEQRFEELKAVLADIKRPA